MERQLISFLMTLIMASLAVSQNQIPPEMQQQIDGFIESVLENQNVPGLGLAVIKNSGELWYTKGYGFADLENGRVADDSTTFFIGSITKSFTATIVVQSLNKLFPQLGESVLDIPIRQLAPGYNFTLGDRYRSEQTSFRDLLAHRVCTMPESVGIWVGAFTEGDDLFYRQRYAPEVCGFRNGFQYNNGLYAVAGDIIAYMMNTTYTELITNFYSSLNMENSTVLKDTDDHNNMPGRSVPYIRKDEEFIRFNTETLKVGVVVLPGGGILSSASDMAKYLNFHLNLGKVGEEQVVPEDVILWLRRVSNFQGQGLGILKTSQNPDTTVTDVILGYGLGFDIGIYDGWLKIAHGGNKPPYESYISFYPELGIGIFTTINGPGTLRFTGMPTEKLHNTIFDIVQGKTRSSITEINYQAQRKESEKTGKPVIQENKQTRFSQQEIIGSFGNGLNGEINISLRENEMGLQQHYIEWGRWGYGWLTLDPNSEARFLIEWASDFWQMSWATQLGPPEFTLTFLDANTFEYAQNGTVLSDNFKRGVTVDDLPEIPWSPGSCGASK